jgi:hypothetical protein
MAPRHFQTRQDARRSRSVGRTLGAWTIAALVAHTLAGCGRPITIQALERGSEAPIEDVRIYRYRFSLFSIFPGMKSTQTGPDGSAVVSVGPSATNLTMLRAGFEPVLLGVFEQTSQALAPDAGGYDYVLTYGTLVDKQVVPVEFRPLKSAPVEITVVDRDTQRPVADAQVYAATFLYLPQPGVERDWGFPPVQDVRTDAEGRATVEQRSGFLNRIAVRVKGYQYATITLDGRGLEGPTARRVELRPLQVKPVDFLVVDAKTRAPIAGAEVSLGEMRDGLPDNPDAWTRTTDAAGRTGLMPVPDMEPFLLSVKARGYEDWRGAPVWRTLVEGQTRRLELRRK